MDLTSGPPWSKGASKRLGKALRDGIAPPVDDPSYADVLRWHLDLGAEVQAQIESASWSIKPELLANKAGRLTTELLVGSRPKTQDTLVEKLQRKPTLALGDVQDLAGVRIDADLYLGEQMRLAREIAEHFGADDEAIHDLREDAHAGYRAVHVWLRLPAGRVEVQIRTILQSLWANFYEKLADQLGRGIRYGEAAEPPADIDMEQAERAVRRMHEMSEMIAARETEWQGYAAATDDPMRGTKLGASSMQRLMMVGAFAHGAKQASSGNAEAGQEG